MAASPQDGPHGRAQQSLPPWSILAGAAILMLLVATFTFGDPSPSGELTADTTTPPDTTTSPDTTATPETTTPTRFDVDGLNDGLTVIVFDGDEASSVRWMPGGSEMVTTAIEERPDRVSLSANGEMALVEIEQQPLGTLHLGPPGGPVHTLAVNVTSAAWHETNPSLLAFTADLPFDDRRWLLVGDVNPRSHRFDGLERITPIDDSAVIATWGEWGYALNGAEEGALDEPGRPFVRVPVFWIVNPDGTVNGPVDGEVVDARQGRVLLVQDYETVQVEAGRRTMIPITPVWSVLDRADDDLHDGDVPLSSPAMRFVGSGDATVFVETDGGTSTVTVESRETDNRQTFRFAQAVRMVDVSADGRFVILHDVLSSELVVIDLASGIRHRVPVPPGRVVAADIR